MCMKHLLHVHSTRDTWHNSVNEADTFPGLQIYSMNQSVTIDIFFRSCLLPISSGTNKVVRTPEGLPANNDNGHSSRNQIKR